MVTRMKSLAFALISAMLTSLRAPVLADTSSMILLDEPAQTFQESCPLGNGRLGAMVFGKVGDERVVLNESTMWSGSPQNADDPNAYKVLPEIRRLLLAGQNREAQDLLQRNFVCRGPGSGQGSGKAGPYGCYQMFANLEIVTVQGQPDGYRRDLDLDRAVASVDYTVGKVLYRREAFVDAPHNVFVYRFTATERGQIGFTARLSRPEFASTDTKDGQFLIKGQLESGNPSIQGVRYEGRLGCKSIGGTVSLDKEGFHVRGADEVILYFSGGTDMFDKNYARHAEESVNRAEDEDFASLESEHVQDYQRFYDRVKLKLPQGPSAYKPTPERLAASFAGEEDPSLAALYFNFGRYLHISSSRPDSPLPANLQGIWAEELQTPWNGDFHLDINVQMNYWLAEVCNLSDCHEPLLRFISRLVPNGEKTAKAYYGARGWVAHVITNPWLFTSPGEGADWGSTTSGSAWLCEHLWNHYAFTRDQRYLASVYPVLKGSAEFYLDMLIAEPSHGWLVTAPSNSPENAFFDNQGHAVNTCMGPTIDNEILRELFANVIEASSVLDQDPELRSRLKDAAAKLPPIQVGKFGQIMEWLQDYPETDVHHRHTSPLYGLYPAQEIDPAETPELAKAAAVTLERRGDMGTGWSLAWKVCFWARLRDGDHAWTLLKRLFKPTAAKGFEMENGGGTYPNLFDAHPPFQIDGNFGATAGIAEMLLQSRGNEIRLLPALPKAWASLGSVTGLKARNNVTVDISWKDGKIVSYHLSGPGAKAAKVSLGI